MKFEDMKKIWDEQNQQHVYVVDEKQLHKSIQAKKYGTSEFVNRMEWMMILANVLAGVVIIFMNFNSHVVNIYSYILGCFLLLSASFIYSRRLKRLKDENRFDRSILGDLEHAISNANYRANLSYLMLLLFIPVGLLTVASAINEDKSIGTIFFIAVFVIVMWFIGRWEHRSWHLANKKRLEAMKEKLVE